MVEKEKVRYETPVIKLAIERKWLSQEQYEECKELLKKSKKIGLESSLEEIFVKQNLMTQEQISELQEIATLGEGGNLYGGYQLGKLLGQGGMGKVYEAVHEFTGRKVALKILNATTSRDETVVTRFFQEIRALAKLVHPGIVTLYDAGKAGRRYFFAMELVNGMSLAQFVEKHRLLPEKTALAITRKIASALHFSHSSGIVHRDIKPENILIDENGSAKITDFGVVMHRDADHMTLTKEGFMVGSVYFASPEQVKGERDIDGRSDLYSLGATLYYMLTGKMVFTGGNAQEVMTRHLVGSFISPKKYNPQVSGRTVRILRKMLAKNRDKRYQSMEELVKALNSGSRFQFFLQICAFISGAILLFGSGVLFEQFFPHVFFK